MKIALVQDQLLTQAGSERVFLYMAEEFRDADLFTLAYNPDTTWPEFKQFQIHVSWMDRWVRDVQRFYNLFPIESYVMMLKDLHGYDIVLTSSATIAKYISRFDGTHICYCYYPTRAIWDTAKYFGTDSARLKAKLFRLLLPYFKRVDLAAAKRVDHFVTLSETSRQAIHKIYGRDSDLLHAPIDVSRFRQATGTRKQEYFLIVSRLETWKRTDFAIDAFTRLNLPLRVVGTGKDLGRLRKRAGPNIEFVGSLNDDELIRAYGEARAVVFTPEIEYGLVPLEALAAGTPVIALGKGGVLEIMIGPNDPNGRLATAVFFFEQTADAVIEAVRRFEKVTFRPQDLQAHAANFDIPHFKTALRQLVERYA